MSKGLTIPTPATSERRHLFGVNIEDIPDDLLRASLRFLSSELKFMHEKFGYIPPQVRRSLDLVEPGV